MTTTTSEKGYRWAEVPTHEYPRRAGGSKIQLRKIWFRLVFPPLTHLYSWTP